jgi:hypothetical protein
MTCEAPEPTIDDAEYHEEVIRGGIVNLRCTRCKTGLTRVDGRLQAAHLSGPRSNSLSALPAVHLAGAPQARLFGDGDLFVLGGDKPALPPPGKQARLPPGSAQIGRSRRRALPGPARGAQQKGRCEYRKGALVLAGGVAAQASHGEPTGEYVALQAAEATRKAERSAAM